MSDSKGTEDNVKVIVRCRPLNSTERGNGNKSIVNCDEEHGQVRVSKVPSSKSVEVILS